MIDVLLLHQDPTPRARGLWKVLRPSNECFKDIDWYETGDGAVMLTGFSATFEVSLEAEVDVGDRILALLRIHRLHWNMDANPLVFYGSRLRQRCITVRSDLHAVAVATAALKDHSQY